MQALIVKIQGFEVDPAASGAANPRILPGKVCFPSSAPASGKILRNGGLFSDPISPIGRRRREADCEVIGH